MKRIAGTPGSYPLDRGDVHEQPRQWRKTALVLAASLTEDVEVETPEGVMTAKAGDYLAQHEDGHAWPIKRETFEGTYEAVS